MGMRAASLSWKIGIKAHIFNVNGPKKSVILPNQRFLMKYGHDSRELFMKKFKKMTGEHSVYERMDTFLI